MMPPRNCVTIQCSTNECRLFFINAFTRYCEVKLLNAQLTVSASFLAELSVSSPRKLSILIIYKNIIWIKVSKKIFYLILKKEALLTVG